MSDWSRRSSSFSPIFSTRATINLTRISRFRSPLGSALTSGRSMSCVNMSFIGFPFLSFFLLCPYYIIDFWIVNTFFQRISIFSIKGFSVFFRKIPEKVLTNLPTYAIIFAGLDLVKQIKNPRLSAGAFLSIPVVVVVVWLVGQLVENRENILGATCEAGYADAVIVKPLFLTTLARVSHACHCFSLSLKFPFLPSLYNSYRPMQANSLNNSRKTFILFFDFFPVLLLT